jgi:hypothetical protein
MQSGNLAPIVLFVYNRLWCTQQTIEALQKNELASESELFIYTDGEKNEKVSDQVSEVRNYIKEVGGFKKVTIIERDKNWGLANSIIDGVTQTVNKYGRVIVLEDDLVTSPFFLRYMNDALEFYKNEEKVMHISGWNYPIEINTLNDVFLWRVMNCWGWATWANNWQYFEKDTDKLINEFTKEDIYKFSLDGTVNFWKQVLLNKKGKTDTWAIYWYASIFKQNGLCLNPVQSFVQNIGHDNSGENCSKTNLFSSSNLSLNRDIKFIGKIAENDLALERIKVFYKLNSRLYKKLMSKILGLLFSNNKK